MTTRLTIAKLAVIAITARPDNHTVTVCSVVPPFTLEVSAATIGKTMTVPLSLGHVALVA
jgi:hypothetical protein